MDIQQSARLSVRVYLLGDPCLWCWEIVDSGDGRVVESSWSTEWTGYDSAREALRAGILRVTDLTRGGRGARLSGQRTTAGGQSGPAGRATPR